MEAAWIVMTVRERPELTIRSLDSVIKHRSKRQRLVVVDNGSRDKKLLDYLYKRFREGNIHRLILNKAGSVPQWQKCYAIYQALSVTSMEKYSYFGWMDNDVVVKKGWLDDAVDVLHRNRDVEVVSCLQDERSERSHKTVKTVDVGDVKGVRLKMTANGAIWVMRRSFFNKYGLPPIGVGKTELGVEDWFYSYKLREEGARFAVIDRAEHIGADDSMRAKVPRAV